MSTPTLFVLLALASLAGAGITLFIIRTRVQDAMDRGRREAAPEIARLSALLESKDENLASLRQEAERRASEISGLNAEKASSSAALATAREALQQEKQRAEERMQTFKETQVTLKSEFEVLANQILEDKSKRFTEQNSLNLSRVLQPLSERLVDFKKTVEEKYDKESKDRTALQEQVRMLAELNQKVSLEANNLASALKGQSKMQGNWGEMILEKLLEASGLRKNEEYHSQIGMKDPVTGKQRYLDAVINLPGDRAIIIDSKVSLTAYERYCSASNDAEKAAALKQHVLSVNEHIGGLSGKNYHTLLDGRSPDFVLLFMAIEPAYMLAAQADHGLFQHAYANRVMIVGPSTLLVTLQTVATVWNIDRQNKHVLQIAEKAGGLHDAVVELEREISLADGHLQKASEGFTAARAKLTSGRGNLVKRVDELVQLGAKAKKSFPDKVRISADANEGSVETEDILPVEA